MKQPKQPDPNPGLIAATQASERIAMEQLGLAREQYSWAKDQAEQDREFIRPFLEQQGRIADANEQRAADYANYEKQTFRPLEQKIVQEAQAYDSEAKRAELARTAAADVGQAMGVAREQNIRNMTRYGVNPASGAFADVSARMDTTEGLAKAQAMNKARTDATALGHAMKMDAAGLGRNLANNATTAYGIALNANAGAQQGTHAMTAAESAGRNSAQGYYGAAMQGYGQAQRGYGMANDFALQSYGTQMQGYGANLSAIGTVAGMGAAKFLSEGGGVSGPGGPRDDKIPAMLSDGEFVIPADVVKVKGLEFFNKLLEKHHRPMGVQRRG
jgi:hypothetical protein